MTKGGGRLQPPLTGRHLRRTKGDRMSTLRLTIAAFFAFAATGSLLGCGGQPASVPMPAGATEVRPASNSGSLARDFGRDLLYVVSNAGVNVYTYPKDKLLGSLGSSGNFVCTNHAGDLFLTTGAGQTIIEYAHGSVIPKVTLSDPYYAGACSVDPVTGSLAVTASIGLVVIFPHNKRNGWRFAQIYTISNASASFPAYDPNGNLFVDGDSSGSGHFVLEELPKGGDAFASISLNQHITGAGGIQWDGNYLAIASGDAQSRRPVVIYRFAISGSSGTLIGSTRLSHSYGGAQYLIQGARVLGQYVNPYYNGVAIWRYPHGGTPIRTFAPQTEAFSEVVSLP